MLCVGRKVVGDHVDLQVWPEVHDLFLILFVVALLLERVLEVREELFVLGQQLAVSAFDFLHKHECGFKVQFAQDVRHPLVVFEVMFQLLNAFVELAGVNHALVPLVVVFDELHFGHEQPVGRLTIPTELINYLVDGFGNSLHRAVVIICLLTPCVKVIAASRC